jgi:hypothetical protein
MSGINKSRILLINTKKFGDKMCDETKSGPMKKEYHDKMHEMRWGHNPDEMKKGLIMKKIFIKKIMEHLSDADKKKILAKKMDMKISMAQQNIELLKEKQKLVAKKMDMKASMAEEKIELLKMVRDMLKE